MPDTPEPAVLVAFGVAPDADVRGLRRGTGCDKCRGKGRKGRLPIHEILMVDGPVRRLIAERAPAEAYRGLVGRSWHTLREDGLAKAMAGLVPIEEVLGAVRGE